MVFLRFVPESVRWLLAKKYNSKAGKIIQKAARVNGVELSENVKKVFELNSDDSDNVSFLIFGILKMYDLMSSLL